MTLLNTLKYKAYRKIKSKLYKKPHPQAVILMYHNIGNKKPDPWELFVSEEHFRQHLQVLQAYHVHPLSCLDEILSQKQAGIKNIFITFDDGCLNNFEIAVPLLRQYGFSATFFIPTQILQETTVFWWEILDKIFWIKEELPEQLNLGYGTNKFTRKLKPEIRRRDPSIEDNWSANRQTAPSERCQLYLDICEWIKTRTFNEQKMITEQLSALCNDKEINDREFKKMSPEQIIFLSKNGFEIGAHTVHHPALGSQDYKTQQEEIELSKRHLENLTGKAVTAFACPHGDFNEETRSIMRDQRYTAACTTDEGAIYADMDRLVLPRLLVRDLDASGFRSQLNNLFNI